MNLLNALSNIVFAYDVSSGKFTATLYSGDGNLSLVKLIPGESKFNDNNDD